MNGKIAEVAVSVSTGLNDTFDYLIPEELLSALSAGSRVLVPFRSFIKSGYVLRIKKTSAFRKRLRPILKKLDAGPVINEGTSELIGILHRDYFCSLSTAFKTVLPRGGQTQKAVLAPDNILGGIGALDLTREEQTQLARPELENLVCVAHDYANTQRWPLYSGLIKQTLNAQKSVIFLVPDYKKIEFCLKLLELEVRPVLLTSHLKDKEHLCNWLVIQKAAFSFAAGTRGAVLAPVNNLGLIIIDEEEHFSYKQERSPYYRAATLALARAKNAQAQLVLGSMTPSLEAYALCLKKKAAYIKLIPPLFLPLGGRKEDAAIRPGEKPNVPVDISLPLVGRVREGGAEVKIIDMNQDAVFKKGVRIISAALQYRIAAGLANKEKTLIFVPKKGFSTLLYCPTCKTVQRCQECSSTLTYYFKEKILCCPHCAYRKPAFEICPRCQAAYVRYGGYGVEKVESELARLFPGAGIANYERDFASGRDYDIILATQSFLEEAAWQKIGFDLVGVIACEQVLGAGDFRATEKAFIKLWRLSSLAAKDIYIQTRITKNTALDFLTRRDAQGFLDAEYLARRETGLPPAISMAAFIVRAAKDGKALQTAAGFYEILREKGGAKKTTRVCEPLAMSPAKLRGYFRYQVLLKYKTLGPLRKTIREILSKRVSGVITTFDPCV